MLRQWAGQFIGGVEGAIAMRFFEGIKEFRRWRRVDPAEFFVRDPSAFGKERVSFDGQVLVLASQSDEAGAWLKEYVPEGESLDSWTRLAAIRLWSSLDDPLVAAAGLIEALTAQNPDAPSEVRRNPDTGEVIADFITWPSDGAFVEFNVFSYASSEGGGLWAQQYALREYNDPEGFLGGLSPVRLRLLGLMAENGLTFKAH
ncbi:hypothetical protein ACWIGI_11310 [Nocardia sp. NPDC055321]